MGKTVRDGITIISCNRHKYSRHRDQPTKEPTIAARPVMGVIGRYGLPSTTPRGRDQSTKKRPAPPPFSRRPSQRAAAIAANKKIKSSRGGRRQITTARPNKSLKPKPRNPSFTPPRRRCPSRRTDPALHPKARYNQSRQIDAAQIYSSESSGSGFPTYGTETFKSFVVIHIPNAGDCVMPPPVDLAIQHTPTHTWQRYHHSEIQNEGGIELLKRKLFNYPSGFDKDGPQELLDPNCKVRFMVKPADELDAPAFSFRHKFGYPEDYRIESTYGEDHDLHGICVKVIYLKHRTQRIFPGLKSELAKLTSTDDFFHPWFFAKQMKTKTHDLDLWQEPWVPPPVVELGRLRGRRL